MIRKTAPTPRARALFSATGLAVILAMAGHPTAGLAGEPAAKVTGDARVDGLLGQMTLDDKLGLIRGVEEDAATNQGQAGYLPGVKRLGVPSLRLADGPPGVLTRHPSPAQTATMGLAATFSHEDARLNGVIIAEEAKRLGIDVVLEPFINIDRDVTFRRGFNTYGEDPVLTGEIGASLIRGIQGEGVMAQAKHFVGFDTNGHDVTIDDQALHEVYLAPFADAISAGVSSIMCSYNLINGDFACGNHATLTDILRGEMGFKGFVTSDWGAVHGHLYINGGLDMEMPGVLPKTSPFAQMMRSYFDDAPGPHEISKPDFGILATLFEGGIPEEPKKGAVNWAAEFPVDQEPKNLWDGLKSGEIKESTVTLAAGRVLYEMNRFGYLDGRNNTKRSYTPDQVGAVIRKTSQDAAVLLKNQDAILPLKADALTSVAMIGPGAGQVVAIGKAGERSVGMPERQVSPVEALRRMTGADPSQVVLALDNDMTGAPVPDGALSHDGQPGLAHAGPDGEGVSTRIDYTLAKGQALKADTSHHWVGTFTVERAGDYWLNLQHLGVRASLWIDGKRVGGSGSMKGGLHGDTVQPNLDNLLPTPDGLNAVRVGLDLAAGPHEIKIETIADGSHNPVQVRLNWSTPEARAANRQAAVDAAKAAKTAVVFVWARGAPAFGLPGDQNALVEAVAAVNPNTVVVLNTSQPVAMPWLSKVKAVVQMWWSGDEGGWATASVLTGKTNPAGRLPFTWGRSLQDYAATDPAHPERSGHGVDGKTVYSEGVDVGYRWFDKQGIEPLFPFGYGLSYTQFAYSDLKIARAVDGGLDVTFKVRNSGAVAGDEVAQVYLGAPKQRPEGVQFAQSALAGFERVSLASGQQKVVSVHVAPRRLQYWSTARKAWADAPSDRLVSVGASSRDLRLNAPLAQSKP